MNIVYFSQHMWVPLCIRCLIVSWTLINEAVSRDNNIVNLLYVFISWLHIWLFIFYNTSALPVLNLFWRGFWVGLWFWWKLSLWNGKSFETFEIKKCNYQVDLRDRETNCSCQSQVSYKAISFSPDKSKGHFVPNHLFLTVEIIEGIYFE